MWKWVLKGVGMLFFNLENNSYGKTIDKDNDNSFW